MYREGGASSVPVESASYCGGNPAGVAGFIAGFAAGVGTATGGTATGVQQHDFGLGLSTWR